MAMASKLGNVLLSLALLVALHGLSLSFLGSGPARVESPRAARSSVARHAEDDDEVGGLGGLMRLHFFFENLSLSHIYITYINIYIYTHNIIYTYYIQIKIRSRNLHIYIHM